MNKRINLTNGVNFNTIETNKFKSNILVYYIVRPLNKDEVTKNALLPVVLRRGTNKYNDNLSIHKRLEELYGAKLGVGSLIRGNKQVLRISLEFVDDKYLDDKEYLDGILEILNEVIFNPKIDNEKFDNDIIKKEKRNLRQRIESKINDKREYAIEQTINKMCHGDSFSIPNLGYIEDIEDIDEKNLYKHYKDILLNSPIEIFYTGNKNEYIENYFKEKDFGSRENILEFERENVEASTKELIEIEESMNVNQGKLVMGFRTSIPYEDDLYVALLVANVIFGGGPNSKLFLNVREKESLAYYILSRIFKYKSIMLLDAGIEFDKFEDTKKIILEELQKMKDGDFTEREIEVAKKAMISGLTAVDDSIGTLTELEFDNILSKENKTITQNIERIKNVSRESIIEASNNIGLDIIYFLKNDKVDEVN